MPGKALQPLACTHTITNKILEAAVCERIRDQGLLGTGAGRED